ncbi:MAG: CRISPR-associated helicase Cas3', partial [candidate division GAL15 bacterium]
MQDPFMAALGLEGEVGLYLLMGGARDDDWLLYPEQEAVIVGTQDMLLSRALNRGYGLSRFRWPAAFGLASSDCLWVVDEVQLMGPGLATTSQLDALRRRLGTAGPAHTLWMSATLAPGWLATVDRPPPATILQMDAADRDHPDLGARLTADKRLYQADVGSVKDRAYPRRLAEWLLRQHRHGTLTLVILNTVERAQAVYRELGRLVRDGGPDLLLLHSRFRVWERRQAEARLHADVPAAGRILVSTQVVEAGVDLSAQTLVTELAPWPSLVQRFGRCNRYGRADGARVFWIDVEDRAAAPYEPEEMALSRQVLREREGSLVSPTALPALDLPVPEGEVLRARDLIDLFDTAPDLSGQDVDVSRFIRDARDLDVQVFWRRWEGAQPSAQEPEPGREEL